MNKWKKRDTKLTKRRFGMRVHGKRLAEVVRNSMAKGTRRKKARQ